METITKKIKVFEYQELSLESKEFAFNQWQQDQTEYFWFDENLKSLKYILDCFKFEVKDYCINSCNGSDFIKTDKGQKEDNLLEISGNRLRKYIEKHYFNYKPLKKFKVYEKNGKKRISKIQYTFECDLLTGYCFDYLLLDVLKTFDYSSLENLIDEICWKFIKDCNNECDYQQSIECFEENYCNDNKFLENGEIY